MVKAGKPVDDFIETLLPHLEPGDIIIDGGNSHFPDTIRRTKYLESKGLLFVGTGVSGGEEGARYGPSIMPGGSAAAWPLVKDIFQAIAAKTPDGEPCCDWVGEDGAGHYVKMVHNGIEYGDMQLICEAYQLMKDGLGMTQRRDARRLRRVEQGRTRQLPDRDHARHPRRTRTRTGELVVDKILDTAGQKGTGKWTSVSSLDLGMPLTLIGEAVYARCLQRDEGRARGGLARSSTGPKFKFDGDRKAFIEDIRQALYASKIVTYAQGFMLLREAAKEYNWNLNYGGIALMWRGGCIIRCAFLGKIKEAFDTNPKLENLLLDRYFTRRDRALPGSLAARGRARPSKRASRCRPSPPRSRTSTATAASGCRPTCCRPSATTSAPTPTSASTSRAASSSTPTGPARAATFRPARTPYDGMSADVTQLASRIRLLLMDVDGVLTDGRLYNVPGPDGKMAETKGFDSQDGIALQWLARAGDRHRADQRARFPGHGGARHAVQVQVRLPGAHREDSDPGGDSGRRQDRARAKWPTSATISPTWW